MTKFDRLIQKAITALVCEEIIAVLEEAITVAERGPEPFRFGRQQTILRVAKLKLLIAVTSEGKAYIAELEKKLG